MNIRLHIDRLVVDQAALGAGGNRRFQAAVTSELTRLLAAGGLGRSLAAGGAIPELRAATMRPYAGGNPTRLGAEVARAVYGGLKNPEGA